MITVLLVDDHPVVRDGYHRLLDNSKDIRVVAEAHDGESACKKYHQCKPNVVVLDLNMPGIGGLETIRRLRAKDSNSSILVFSMHDSKVMVTRALDAGAKGFITKSSAASHMLEAIRQVAQGQIYLSHHLVSDVIQISKLPNGNPLSALSRREFQVFQKLADGSTVNEIADVLSISPKTVGVHQTNIMNKLELRNMAELTRLAIRCGVIAL